MRWALERACPFRKCEDWQFPEKTAEELGELRWIAEDYDKDNVFNGIWIRDWTNVYDEAGNPYKLPLCGLRITDRMEPFGGLARAKQTCEACPANVPNLHRRQMAGCFGYLLQRPHWRSLEEEVWQAIEQCDLEAEVRSAFPITTPLWYGFWIESPLRPHHRDILRKLLSAMDRAAEHPDDLMVRFVQALRKAARENLPMHVSMAPPGHTDFGIYTIHPHCPRCQAIAEVKLWESPYPRQPYTCQVCGHEYRPNDHHGRERYDDMRHTPYLEELLGTNGLKAFQMRYLMYQGCNRRQAWEVLEKESRE
ncbi:hypothetical protein C5Y93_14675 [Blastopirellula marina]|uniref:Uncharacterized protein n=1 Tax=Blastopirellula marina TaxID=124 RepID=A0A2S8GL91_9BACT|nr:hypothetical protein C5Y93_14675 [Blastopirellula marina]